MQERAQLHKKDIYMQKPVHILKFFGLFFVVALFSYGVKQKQKIFILSINLDLLFLLSVESWIEIVLNMVSANIITTVTKMQSAN